MTTFSIQNFGCRATEADSASLRLHLLSKGLELVEEHSSADVVVLHTCTVTAAADAQARETVRRVRRENPSARIVVTGCYAQRAPEELATLPGVSLVVGNSRLSEIPDALAGQGIGSGVPSGGSAAGFVALSQLEEPISLARGPTKILTGDIFEQTAISAFTGGAVSPDRTRPILKIQDGCNHRCSYCVIPFVRGGSRSLAPEAVIQEIRKFVSAGAKEVVLSGINLGSYGRDLTPRADLAKLVGKILWETELPRLRFSSIEPQDVTQDFIDLVASSGRMAPHFHAPLQSGSDRILKAMHRWYRAGHYAERVKLIRKTLPNAGIGADVIAGFPGETDEDFAKTIALIEQLPLTYLHVFSFSVRPGTAAARLPSFVPGPLIRERAQALRWLGEKKAAAFRMAQRGRAVEALTLHRSGENWTPALTGNYLKVRVAGERPANLWCTVEISGRAEELALEVPVSAGERAAAAAGSHS
jgi:threonylcarbamoyladenosine tRNA methylthiotransferase MtaB